MRVWTVTNMNQPVPSAIFSTKKAAIAFCKKEGNTIMQPHNKVAGMGWGCNMLSCKDDYEYMFSIDAYEVRQNRRVK